MGVAYPGVPHFAIQITIVWIYIQASHNLVSIIKVGGLVVGTFNLTIGLDWIGGCLHPISDYEWQKIFISNFRMGVET